MRAAGQQAEPEEIARCLDHLDAEVAELARVQVVVALGKIAFDVWLRLLKRRGDTIVTEAAVRARGGGTSGRAQRSPAIVIGCYHPSRQNTNTGKLTPAMMERVFRKAKELLK